MTLVIAHRGASAYEPENSLAAFRLAHSQGADGVELDVHVSADGVPVVHHDPVVGGQAIFRQTAAVLRQHRLANGEVLPTLAEVLAALGHDSQVYVELKELAPQHDAQLLAVLDRGPILANYHIHGFDHRIIQRLRAQRPDLPAGILAVARPVRPFIAMEDAGAGVLWQQEALIDAELVEGAHSRGYRVFAWTVDDPDRMRTLVSLGVDAICSNRPDVAREVIG